MSAVKVYHKSDKQTWETPQWLFEHLNDEFSFDLDVCAEDSTAKVSNYYTVNENALTQTWEGVCWCNPPYSQLDKWVKKAFMSAKHNLATVVMLIPARVDTKVWWNFCQYGEVRFIKGRLKFGDAENTAPFPSAIVIFRPGIPESFRNVVWVDYKTDDTKQMQLL